MIRAVGDKIVVKPVKSERVSPGGIVMPETDAKKRDMAAIKAEICDIGPLAFEAEKKHEQRFGTSVLIPQVGHRIMMGRYAGYEVKEGDETYRIIDDEDVTAVLEEAA